MPKITVKAKIDGGTHIKYGPIIKGQEYSIEEEDFGAELFERPQGFESPHERADREAQELRVKGQEASKGLDPCPLTPDPDLPTPSPQSPITNKGGK
jgi:hypothetical protein